MTEKKRITTDSLIVIGSTYFLHVIGMIVGLVNSRILGPVNIGLMSGLQLIIFWSGFLHLGILSAAQREIPYFITRGDRDKARIISGVSAIASFLPTLLVSLGIIAFALIQRPDMEPRVFWGVMTSAGWLFLVMTQSYIMSVPVRGYSRFDAHAWGNIFMGTCGQTVSILAVYWSGIYGLYGFQLITILIYIFTVKRILKFRIHFQWDRTEALRLIGIGFPLMLVSMAIIFSQTIDRALILSIVGGEPALALLGMLYVSNIMVTFLMVAINSFSSVILPTFRARIGEHPEPKTLIDIVEGPTLLFSFCMAIFVSLTSIWAAAAVRWALPQFAGGIGPMYIFAWIGFVATFEIFSSVILSTLDRQWHLLIFPATALALQIILDIHVLKSGGGLIQIACVTLAARGLIGLCGFLYGSSRVLGFRRSVEIGILSLIPGVASALAVIIGIIYMPYTDKQFMSLIFTGSLRSLIVLGAWVPLLLLLKRRTSLFEVGKAVWKKLSATHPFSSLQ